MNFVSETVLVGFKAGVALHLASTQLPKLLGDQRSRTATSGSRIEHFLTHLGRDHSPRRWRRPRGPRAAGPRQAVPARTGRSRLFVVVGGIVAAGPLGLEARGVKLLGDVPQGLPPPACPRSRSADLNTLLPLAMACFLLARSRPPRSAHVRAQARRRLDANQEFLALAGANLAAGLGRGFPVSGGMSQSLVNESGGARARRCPGLFASGLILLVVLFLSGLLQDLPQPVLAAIVLMAVLGLFKVSALKHLWRTDKQEFLVAAWRSSAS